MHDGGAIHSSMPPSSLLPPLQEQAKKGIESSSLECSTMLEEAATLPTRLETSASAGPGTDGGDGSSDPLGAALLSAALAHAAPYSASGADTSLSATSELAPVVMESRRRGRGRPRSVSVLPQAPPITAPRATAEADAVVDTPLLLVPVGLPRSALGRAKFYCCDT